MAAPVLPTFPACPLCSLAGSVVRVVIIAFELAVHTKRRPIAVQGATGTFNFVYYLGCAWHGTPCVASVVPV